MLYSSWGRRRGKRYYPDFSESMNPQGQLYQVYIPESHWNFLSEVEGIQSRFKFSGMKSVTHSDIDVQVNETEKFQDPSRDGKDKTGESQPQQAKKKKEKKRK